MNKKMLFLVYGSPLFIGLALYLSGITYFMLFGANIDAVTPYTIIEQWRDYHDDTRYQKSLTFSLLVGFGIAVVAPLFVLLFAKHGLCCSAQITIN